MGVQLLFTSVLLNITVPKLQENVKCCCSLPLCLQIQEISGQSFNSSRLGHFKSRGDGTCLVI